MPSNSFAPTVGGTKTLAVTAVSASVTLDPKDVASATNKGGHTTMRLYNAGPNVAFVRWGVGPQVATANDVPLIPGVVELFAKSYSDDTVAAISPGGTGTVYVTCGEGV